ncbi:MAG: NAD-dependent epimerase/dehydratase family protein [Planctomycetes bacterium]|nr:NAD-dependent epimerase/dehydratase family protein [Planctomycetota bacterium]
MLVTGAAGFIGSHLRPSARARRHGDRAGQLPAVLRPGDQTRELARAVGAVELHVRRGRHPRRESARAPVRGAAFDAVIHLAAMAGVRPSIQDPGSTSTSTSAARSTCYDASARRARARCLRLVVVGVRRQQQGSVPRDQIRPIGRCRRTRRRSAPAKCSRMRTTTCSASRSRACASSRSMGRASARRWRSTNSRA